MEQIVKIRPLKMEGAKDAVQLWNARAESGEVLYTPLTEAEFLRKFFSIHGLLLAAECGGRFAGFAHAVEPEAKQKKAFLTVVMVSPAFRRLGIGRALIEAVWNRMAAHGAESLWISSVNPVNLAWRIPGTPGYEHNNMPGADMDAPGYGFLLRLGFQAVYLETAMYLNLSEYKRDTDLDPLRARLLSEGIYTGCYDPAWDYGFDRLCDRVGSEYWRSVLKTEIAAWKTGQPNADPAFWADDTPPTGPRPLLIAAHEGEIIGFTGPVDVQKNGRGWFTGLCADPQYQRRGIGKALFHLLLQAFIEHGAAYASLFTGMDNPARRLYLSAGFRQARPFALMRLDAKNVKKQ